MTLLLLGLERAAWLKRRFGATIEWLPFDLHPEYPPHGISTKELDQRYGGRIWRDRIYAMFDAAGLPYSREITHAPNSRRAQQLIELTRDRGRHGTLHHGAMDAYWHRARDIGGPAVLPGEAARPAWTPARSMTCWSVTDTSTVPERSPIRSSSA